MKDPKRSFYLAGFLKARFPSLTQSFVVICAVVIGVVAKLNQCYAIGSPIIVELLLFEYSVPFFDFL
jgi:hypothetical protein